MLVCAAVLMPSHGPPPGSNPSMTSRSMVTMTSRSMTTPFVVSVIVTVSVYSPAGSELARALSVIVRSTELPEVIVPPVEDSVSQFSVLDAVQSNDVVLAFERVCVSAPLVNMKDGPSTRPAKVISPSGDTRSSSVTVTTTLP